MRARAPVGPPGRRFGARPPEMRRIASLESGFEPLATLPTVVPASYRGRWERLAREAASSYRAAVELKCLDCACWQRLEAKRCEIASCPLWALNGRIFGGERGDG